MGILEDFDDIDQNDDRQIESFAKSLLERAEKGEHEPLPFIRNPSEAKEMRILKKANSKLAKGFSKAADKLCREYLEKLRGGIDDLQKLFNYRAMMRASEFFAAERDMAADRLAEYRTYLFAYGHWFEAYVLWNDRPEEALFDYRSKPAKKKGGR